MLKLVIILAFVAASQSVGRNPTKSDHALCRKVYCNETNEELNGGSNKSPRVKIEAYNAGKSGSPCKTTCRFVGKIQKKLAPLNSPDSTKCGDDMNCQSGQCVSDDTAPAASQDVVVVREEDTTDEKSSSKDDTTIITKVETNDSEPNKNPELLDDQTVTTDEKTEDLSTKQESTKDETTKEETTDNQSKKEKTREVLVNDETVANDETKTVDESKTVDETKSTKDESTDNQSTKDESTQEERESTKDDKNEEESSS